MRTASDVFMNEPGSFIKPVKKKDGCVRRKVAAVYVNGKMVKKMNDMVCPYCGAEWEHEYDDFSYTEVEGEYECPSCERVFIMSGELEPVFYEETAEEYYERKISLAKGFVEYYKDKIAMCIKRRDKKEGEYYKSMLDMYYLPDLKELEESLERCVEHNKKVCEEND